VFLGEGEPLLRRGRFSWFGHEGEALTPGASAPIRDEPAAERIVRAAIGRTVFAGGIDYNLCSDPEASVAVLGAGFATTLVTADVTLQTWMAEADVEALGHGGPLARALAELVRVWAPVQQKRFRGLGGEMDPDNQAFLHGPLTVLALVEPSALRFEELRIVPTIEGGVLRTLEVAPGAGMGAAMRVATAVDAPAARRAIVERLTRV